MDLLLIIDCYNLQHYADYLLSAATDDGKDDTEGEEFKKARELRREEVRLQPLPVNLPTDTETEVSLVEIFSFGYGKTNVLFFIIIIIVFNFVVFSDDLSYNHIKL